MFTAGKQLDGIFASAFPALETLDEAHERTFLLSTASTRSKMEKPRAKLARGFHQPFRSCLAVFYVEQVALNRHVQCQKNKEQSETKLQVISPIASASRRTFPACQRGHFAPGI